MREERILLIKKWYLNTEHWKNLRGQAIQRSNANAGTDYIFGICELCGYSAWKQGVMQLHHINYNHTGKETLEDVQLLCPHCHAKTHGREIKKRC